MFSRRMGANGETVVRLEGALDAANARAVGQVLEEAPWVLLDFSGTKGLDDYGMSQLAAEILRNRTRTTVCGLRPDQERLLRCLTEGVPLFGGELRMVSA
jgi:anti-anti-sigma regulatory factor